MAHSNDHKHGNGHGHEHHITSQGKLLGTFGFLFIMMAATIGAAKFMPEPIHSNTILMNIIAVGIAFFKAWAVIAIFMGVRYTTKLVRLYAIGGFVWFFLLFIMMADYGTRQWEPVRGWENVDASSLPRDPKRVEGLDDAKPRKDMVSPGAATPGEDHASEGGH